MGTIPWCTGKNSNIARFSLINIKYNSTGLFWDDVFLICLCFLWNIYHFKPLRGSILFCSIFQFPWSLCKMAASNEYTPPGQCKMTPWQGKVKKNSYRYNCMPHRGVEYKEKHQSASIKKLQSATCEGLVNVRLDDKYSSIVNIYIGNSRKTYFVRYIIRIQYFIVSFTKKASLKFRKNEWVAT